MHNTPTSATQHDLTNNQFGVIGSQINNPGWSSSGRELRSNQYSYLKRRTYDVIYHHESQDALAAASWHPGSYRGQPAGISAIRPAKPGQLSLHRGVGLHGEVGYFDEWYALFKKYQIAILDKEKEEESSLSTSYSGRFARSRRGKPMGPARLIYYKSREAQAPARHRPEIVSRSGDLSQGGAGALAVTSRHYDLPITEVDPHVERTGGN